MADEGDPVELARELLEAARLERAVMQRLSLVLPMERLGDPDSDETLGELFAEGLHLAAHADDATPEIRRSLCNRLAALTDSHRSLPFAVFEARVLALLAEGLGDGDSSAVDASEGQSSEGHEDGRLLALGRLLELGEQYHSEQIAIAKAVTCFHLAANCADPDQILASAEQVAALNEEFPVEALARIHAGTLVLASALLVEPTSAWAVERKIEGLAQRWRGHEFAEDHATVIANALDLEADATVRQSGMRRLRQLLDAHHTERLALTLAHALYQVHGVDGGAAECRYVADELRELNERYRSTGIALASAQVLRNATAEADTPLARRHFAAELEALVADYPDAPIAAEVVHGLANELLGLEGHPERLALLERMCALLRRFPDPDAADRACLALALEQQRDRDPARCGRRAALAHGLLAARPSLREALQRGVDAVVGRIHDGDTIERVEELLRGPAS